MTLLAKETSELEGVWFVLLLNDMQFSKVEIVSPVARARSAAELQQLVERERVEGYCDGRWGKTFRRGGPLEWKNDPRDGSGDIIAVYAVAVPSPDTQIVTTETLRQVPTLAELEQKSESVEARESVAPTG